MLISFAETTRAAHGIYNPKSLLDKQLRDHRPDVTVNVGVDRYSGHQ